MWSFLPFVQNFDRQERDEYDPIIFWLSASPTAWFTFDAFRMQREGRECEEQRGGVLQSLHLHALEFARLMFWKTRMGKKLNFINGSAWLDLFWKGHVHLRGKPPHDISSWKCFSLTAETLNTKATDEVHSLHHFPPLTSRSCELQQRHQKIESRIKQNLHQLIIVIFSFHRISPSVHQWESAFSKPL